jgi:putative nucleotidyltransferase with HDIG domain
MAEINQQKAQRLANLLSGAIKGMAYYPAGHPAVMTPINDMHMMLAEILLRQPELRLGIHDGVFFVDEILFFTPQAAIDDLTERLSRKQIVVISIFRGVALEQLNIFVSLLSGAELNARMINSKLAESGIKTIAVVEQVSSEAAGDEREGETLKALETYGEALGAIREVFKEIESGRIPSSDKIIMVVNNLATMTMQDPAALVGLAMIKDYDNYTFNHSVNVGVLAMALAASLGLEKAMIEDIGIAGFLHDIGKTRLEKEILNKPGKLSAVEFEMMKKHSEDGSKIISEMAGINPQVAHAVLGHHIHHDRLGYPEWARALQFDTMTDIISVADCYDAITTLRVYQQPMNPKAAVDQIRRLAGKELDRGLVETFVDMMGMYPVGTLIRLDTNEIAVVFRPNPGKTEAPLVKIIFDTDGNKLEPPKIQRLVDDGGNCYANIVAVVDPLAKNIEVSAYLN